MFREHLQKVEHGAQSRVEADGTAPTPFVFTVCRLGEGAQPPTCHGLGDAVRGVGVKEQCRQTQSEGTGWKRCGGKLTRLVVFQVGGVGRRREADIEGMRGVSGREPRRGELSDRRASEGLRGP